MLTDTQCRAAKGKEKAYKLSDSSGLYLHVATSGHRTWRHKYRYGEKERHRVIGTYPAVGLKEAREARDSDKKLLKSGLDPITEAKRVVSTNREAAADTFETVAREW
ncbi:MAG: Arm DNA-binding domain-containing protein, partial [Novosphingobium sp.]|nr:Arm DNA-binding domain-containing protein [Novosphingobium sp.]